MADKRIQDLTPASSVQTSDRFVLEQDGQAKSLTGQVLISDLATALDGHGGISNIDYTPPSSGSVDGTITVTLADGTEETFTIENGVGIESVDDKWAVSSSNSVAPSTWYDNPQTMTATDRYEWHYQIITLSDGTSINTDEAVVGIYGDTGDADHVYFKWAAVEPTSDSDMSSTPDAWIGVATTTADSAPSHYTDYSWYEYKGTTGDTGNGIVSITLESSSGLVDTYKVLFDDGTYTTFNVTNGSNINSITKTSTSGLIDTYTVLLTNGDTTSFNVVNAKSITSITNVDVTHVAGHTDVYRINYNDGDTFTFSIYNGTNGSGSVSTVDGVAADGTQNVPLLLLGSGAPTTSTVGILKQRYFDQTNSVLYICTGIDSSGGESTYTWQGAGVTVDNALSLSSTNPVQNAVLTSIIGLDSLDTTAQTLTGAVNELKADMSGFAENIAEEYDPTATYAINDLCIYNNTLYRCNTAISTPEAWNSIHWTQTTVDEQLDTIHDEIGNNALPTTAQTITGAIAEHETDIDGKVSKSGDTMTDNLLLQNNSSNVAVRIYGYEAEVGTASAKQTGPVTFLDKNGTAVGQVYGGVDGSGNPHLALYGRRVVNGSTVYNTLQLTVDSNGNRIVTITAPQAWRSALGLGTSGALPITIAQGGTGATTAAGAVANLGFGSIQMEQVSSANGTTFNITLGSSKAGFLITTGSGANARELTWWNCTSAGNVSFTRLRNTSNLTITNGTNKLTIKNETGAYIYCLNFWY